MGNLKAEVVLEWGDGERLFSLKGAQIEELQHVCGNIGYGAIYQRVMLGQWFWGDLYHTVRLGLIGGGMGAVEAKRLTDFYMGNEAGENRAPLGEGANSPLNVAQSVLTATMVGMEDIPAPKTTPGKARQKSSASRNSARRSSEQG